MQDYETSQNNESVLEDTDNQDHFSNLIRTWLKKIVVFICYGPGVLGVLWIIGRLFKR